MSIIRDVLIEELDRLKTMKAAYEDKLLIESNETRKLKFLKSLDSINEDIQYIEKCLKIPY